VKWAFTTGEVGKWFPLAWLSFMTDVQMFGVNAHVEHLVNVIFHIANAVVLFLLLARMTGAVWRSAMVGALFAWHPLHVEPVAWIIERTDVLSTLMALLSIWVYVRYAESGRRQHLWGSLLLFALALMAKPMVITLPFVVLLLDYWPLRRFPSIREKLPFFAMSAAVGMLTYVISLKSGTIAQGVPLPYRLTNALLAYASYLRKTFYPSDLAVIYPVTWTAAWWQIAAALVVLAGISVLAICWARSRPWFLVGWLWFLGILVPVIGLIQAGSQGMADRYTYLSLVGIFLMLVWAGAELKVGAVAAGITLCGALVLTSRQIPVWRNSQTIFEHAVAVTKDNDIAHGILGRVLASSGRFNEAEVHFEEALRINPNQADAHFGLGVILARKGHFDEALRHYNHAIAARPDAPAHYNLGNVLMKTGRPDEAIIHFAAAARLDPQMAEAQNNWAYALTTEGRLSEAAEHYDAALRINPGLVQARMNAARIREELAH
jgi:tetratricopeptide (TPR) repeat protein